MIATTIDGEYDRGRRVLRDADDLSTPLVPQSLKKLRARASRTCPRSDNAQWRDRDASLVTSSPHFRSKWRAS